jgi:DNA-binding CsgD family transcriptional regulator/type II secretory pathway predicted ATPase ExeA/tetratricopeptide (TPR) repeat protein
VADLSPLIGRDDERERLSDALERCRSGRGGLVLVTGESGVGKSRLVAELLRGWDGRRLGVTAVPGAGAYEPLLALMGARHAGPARDAVGGPAGRVVAALREAFAGEPTVLLLDDLHLADSATLDALPLLAQAMEAHPVLMVGVYRSDELPRGHALRRMRAELRRQHRLVEIALRPLTEDQTGELLAALLEGTPARRLVSAVHARSDGLPFFVEELAAALSAGDGLETGSGALDLAAQATLPLPESVLDAVLARTAALREHHADAVEYAATLGVHVDLPALVALVGAAQADALLDAGLLLEFEGDVAVFRHALVREALYRSIPWARRRGRHERVAELLGERGAPAAVVAEHWIGAHAPHLARPLLLAAAERHCAGHGYRDAAALAARALSLWPEGEQPDERLAAVERLADCAELSGDPASALPIWVDLAHRHRAAGEPAKAACAHRRAANAAELVGDLARATAERTAAGDAFADAGAPAEAAVERLILAEQLRSAGRMTEALERAVEAAKAAATVGRRDIEAHALALQGALRSALGDGRRGVELARAGLQLALSEGLADTASHTYYVLAEALENAADYAGAVEAYESAFELCRMQGQAEFAQICYVCMSPAARLMGEWDRTLAICAEVLADGSSSVLTRRVAEEESGLITALRGDARRARGPLRRAAEFGQANGIFGLEVGATWGLAVVAELEDDERGTRDTVARLLDRCGSTEECHYALPALRWAATFLAGCADVDGVSTCHRVVATLATRNGSPKVLSALAHVGGELAMAEREADRATGQFARSVELLSGITAPYEQAHTELRWGQACAFAGDRSAAVATVTTAYRTAHRLRAKPLALRCATALVEMGEQVDRRLGRLAARALEPAGLTRREQEVLRHLVEGRTNREIAAALFLSTRTVDMHVRNLLTKLDCSSRTAAVRRASALGLVPASA